ncbi:MAG: hypothetical protein MUQ10_16790, partial [Anaerolineae bacterium]|nr:hypothetical protein [Anaerolineae bacterium]
ESTNYSTAKEMGEPTARFFADRQQDIIWCLQDLLAVAYRRFCLITGVEPPTNPQGTQDLDFQVTVTEVARADNESLAKAIHAIIQALAIASNQGWLDDETALSIALKFAGEILPIDRVREILTKARAEYDDRLAPGLPAAAIKPVTENEEQDQNTPQPYILNPNRPDEPKFDVQPEPT